MQERDRDQSLETETETDVVASRPKFWPPDQSRVETEFLALRASRNIWSSETATESESEMSVLRPVWSRESDISE